MSEQYPIFLPDPPGSPSSPVPAPGGSYISWDADAVYTYYNGNWGKSPRTIVHWDEIDQDARFLLLNKTQELSLTEKQNALRSLGIDRAHIIGELFDEDTNYGLCKYTNDWRDSGTGDPEEYPLTLTRYAIVHLFGEMITEYGQSIFQYAQEAQNAALNAEASAQRSEEAAEKAQLAYGSYARIMLVEPYLYDIWYDTLDYKYAYDYYSSADAGYGTGSCSAVRNGNFFGRNYDWTYDNNAEFIVHTDAEDGRHAVLGTAASIPGLTDEFVRSGASSILYKLVPFQLVDGINDAGLVINMNVVPRQDLDKEHYPDVELDRNTNKYIYPIGGQQDEKVRVSIMMLPRFVLDNFSRVQEAIGWLQQNATIYFPDKLLDMGYEIHCLLADKTNTRCIEFINGAINVIDINYITNFHVSGVQFNTSGKLVYTPIDASAETNPKYPTIENGIEKYGSGLERINIIDAGYTGANTLQGMKSLMESIYYSRAYSGNNWEEPTEQTWWYTEFVEIPIAQGSGILTTVDTNIADYAYGLSVVDDRFIHRNRSVPGAWQTTHSIVYDIANLKSYIAVQEADKTVVTYHQRELQADVQKQDVLSSVNAGQNVAIRDKGQAYDHKPEIVAAGFNGELDNDLVVGCGNGGQAASCLLSVGNPQAAGQLLVKRPGSDVFENLATFDIIGGRTVDGMVSDLNHDIHCRAFQDIAVASVYPGGFIKITQKQVGSAGNNYIYKTGSPDFSEEEIQFPCFGVGEVKQGSLVPGRDAATDYTATVNGENILLDKPPVIEQLESAAAILKHNHVYEINESVTEEQLWTVQQGATAEIYIDCTITAYNVNWPNSWIWGDSGVFKVSESTLYKPALALGTVTCVVVRKHGNDVIAHVEYVIDKN